MPRGWSRGKFNQFLEAAIGQKKNVVFSGSVGTGKTHNLRAFTHSIRQGTRIVTIEDTEELINLPHSNVVNLFYSKGNQGSADVTAEDLVECALRMGMGCILNQELRDEAAHAFMEVIESGHFGMTTTHAGSADETKGRIKSLIKKHPVGRALDDAEIMKSLDYSIDVIAYCERDGKNRMIKEILYGDRKEAA